jgi:hypothetical protein
MEKCVLGEFRDSALNCEENLIGGILNWAFLGVSSGFHVDTLRRGDIKCCFCALGECFGQLDWV